MAISDIVIRVITDSSGMNAGMAKAEGGLSGSLNKMSAMAGVSYAAMGLAAYKFGKASIDAAAEAERAQVELEGAYKRFSATHDVTLKQLEDLATATLNKTRFDDEQAKSAEAVLAQFKLTGTQIISLLPLMADLAVATGKTLPAAAETFGKATLGNTRALKELGINYKLTGDSALDTKNIIQLLTDHVGGRATEDAKTYAGQLAMMKNQFGEIEESVGAILIPVMSSLAVTVTPVLRELAIVVQYLADHFALAQTIALYFAYALGGIAAAAFWAYNNIAPLRAVVDWLAGAVANVAGIIWGTAVAAFNDLANAAGWLMSQLHGVFSILDRIAGIAHTVGSVIGSVIPGRSAPSAGGASFGGAAGPSAFGLGGGGGTVSGGAAINVNLVIHGNVGDEATIGRRVIGSLEAYIAANGARRVQQLVTPLPSP